MASPAPLLQLCLEEAARAARVALERVLDDTLAGLEIAETQSTKMRERDQFAQACRELQRNRPAWLAQYPGDLLVAFEASALQTASAGLQVEAPVATAPSRQGYLSNGFSGGGTGFSLEGLSLVDDADVSQAIETSRLLQQVLPAVDATLAELDKLISGVQGLANVRRELNPLRPEVFTSTLRNLMTGTASEPAIEALWLRQIAQPLGRELKLVYERVVNQLEMANVQGVSYRVVQTPSGGGGRGAGGSGSNGAGRSSAAQSGRAGRAENTGNLESGDGQAGGSAYGEPVDATQQRGPSQYADLSDRGVQDAMFRAFLHSEGGAVGSGSGGGGGGGEYGYANHGIAPAYYDNIEEELRALKGAPDSITSPLSEISDVQYGGQPGERGEPPTDYRELPAVDRPPRAVDARSQLSQKVWGAFGRRRARAVVRTELKKEARRVGQVLGLETIRKLVDQVALDPRLLTPVREAIVALEPSLLRLAMVDTRFFKDEAHAGRRLMERVAQRSFKYNDEFSSEFIAFFEPVAAQFNQLNSLTITDAQPFAQALTELDAIWIAQDREEAAQRHAMLAALRFAEERQSQADDIAFDLSQRTDLNDVPGVVLDFLFGPWALVLSHARLIDTRNQIDPQGYGSVVPDLIWSSKRAMTLKQPAKLIEMIPGLLTRLHAGLATLGKEPLETEPFFAALMRLHQPVLKLRRIKTQQDAEESANAPLEPEEAPATPEQRLAKAAAQPWIAREELVAAGFEDTLASQHGELGEADDLAAMTRAASGAAGSNVIADSSAADGNGNNSSNRLNSVHGVHSGLVTGDSSAAGLGGAGAFEQPAANRESTGAPLAPLVTAVVAPAALLQEDAEALLGNLRTGAWVDLFARRQWRRAQLVWASSKGTLFMFVSHGGQPHSMTRRSCEKLIRERLLRPVATHGVVAQALDAVASQAVEQAAAQDAARSSLQV